MNHETLRSHRRISLPHWLLLLALLLATVRVSWDLGVKNLWWDESLSLQRAEGGLGDLLTGRLTMTDGLYSAASTDQHPPVFFTLLGLLLRLAGSSEFVLRWPAAMAAVLIVPAAWALARRLGRRGVLPPATAGWAALLAALNPFYLWYGQEARMYTLVAALALLSTYVLIRWAGGAGRRWQFGYLSALALLLGSHYLSVLILPVHAVLIYTRLAAGSRRRAALAAGALLGGGLLLAAGAAWLILSQPGGGSNFHAISLRQLGPDLLNAFSLGLSVNIEQVWPLDLVFGGLALLGAAGGLRSRRVAWRGGWLLPAALLLPIALLQVVNRIQPAYMNARHLSLISGIFVLLVAGGLGWLWAWRRWAGAAVGGILLAAMLVSTVNYFTVPQYAKDDFAGLGDYLRREMQPGDLLLLNPRDMLRLYRYYLPVDALTATGVSGAADWRAVPSLWGDWPETERQLELLRSSHRRIWSVTSLMFPYADPQRRVENWLGAHALRVREESFYSPNSILELKLYLPAPPVVEGTPDVLPNPLDAVFGDRVRLAGYAVGQPLWPGAALPVTLYWQAAAPIDRRYKYILRLESADRSARPAILTTTEREPYDGAIATVFWRPGITIIEHSAVALAPGGLTTGCCRLTLQIYDAETLQKLPLTAVADGTDSDDRLTLTLPHLP